MSRSRLPWRAGLFNLGAEGQLAVGILAAALVGARLSPSLPPIWAVSVTLVAAATAGAALGALPGWLRGRFGAHEVVTTLMLNGLIAVLSTWLYGGPLRVGEQIHTRAVVAAARIPMLGTHFVWFRGSALSLAVLLAIAAPFCAELLLKRTSIGLRVRAVGSNPTAARAVGVSVPRTYAGAMAIAGAFAGLAGVHYVLGSKGYAEDSMGAGVGLAGIAVALLAGRHSVGILFAALLLATLSVGGLVVNALVPADILAVVQALILVAVASFAGFTRDGHGANHLIAILVVFMAQTVSASVPIVFAALAGTVSERSGVATISLEGYLLGGAFGAAVAGVATGSVAAALVLGALCGAVLGALFAVGTVTLRADAIVVGVAINLLAAAGSRVALKVLYDSASNSPPLLTHASREGSVVVVMLFEALSEPTSWLAPVCVACVVVMLRQSTFGLHLRAAGEHPEACRAQGLSIARIRWSALILGGALGGIGGVHLALTQHEFVAYMSAGRGFLAMAAVILGGWRPLRVSAAAVAIGMTTALDATLAGHVPFPTVVLQAIPFVGTLIAVVGLVGRTRPPRTLGAGA